MHRRYMLKSIFTDKHVGKIGPQQGRLDRRAGVEEVRQRAQERVPGRPERHQHVLLHHLLANLLLQAAQNLHFNRLRSFNYVMKPRNIVSDHVCFQ